MGHGVSSCIFCNKGHGVSGKVVSNHKHIYYFGFPLQLLLVVAADLNFVKSRCSRFIGPVASMGTSGALTLSPSWCKHCLQFFMADFTSNIIPGHQNHSSNREAVLFWPWWPTSWWQPSIAFLLWALGTMETMVVLACPFNLHFRESLPLTRMRDFCLLINPNPSEVDAKSPRWCLRDFSFPNCIHSIAFQMMGSLFWASSQLITCISSFGIWAVDTHTHSSSSPCWLMRTVNSARFAHLMVVSSKIALTSWMFSDLFTQLRASVAALFLPC